MPFTSLHLPNNWYTQHLDVTDSTMLRLREPSLLSRPEEFTLVTTDYQTAGRGQKGTSWESDAGKNLLFGFTFHPTAISASKQFALSEVLALSVADALAAYTDSITIKWPNDIYWKDCKICGMLLEHDICGNHIETTITGVGININQIGFKSDAPNPISLLQITDKPTDRTAILKHILQRFTFYYRKLQLKHFDEVHSLYMSRLYRHRGLHTYKDQSGLFRAEIVDISPLGVLTLRREDQSLRSYAFKEISYII